MIEAEIIDLLTHREKLKQEKAFTRLSTVVLSPEEKLRREKYRFEQEQWLTSQVEKARGEIITMEGEIHSVSSNSISIWSKGKRQLSDDTGKLSKSSYKVSVVFESGEKLYNFTKKDLVRVTGTIKFIDVDPDNYDAIVRNVNGELYIQNTSFTKIGHSNKPEGCFIATAVYDSYDAPQVIILRHYRDETLSTTLIGRLLIKLYYKISPKIAKSISKSDQLKKIIDVYFLLPWINYLKKVEKRKGREVS